MAPWQPYMGNDDVPLMVGPKTRKLAKGPRKSRWTLKILAILSGHRLAKWATRVTKWRGLGRIFFYDEKTNLYFSQEKEVHAFSHPKRLWTVFHGQIARGRKMAYEYLIDQITFEDGDRIIDVGANTGDLALSFRLMKKRVHIDAFEPSPGEFSALTKNLQACTAVISHKAHQIALWNEASEGLTFYLKPAKGDSSILPIANATGEVRVPGKRLDELLQNDGKRYRLLKLEAEGAEPEILQGAEGLLQSIDYIAADVGFERGIAADSTLPEVTNFLLQRNFEIVAFEGGRLVLLFRNRNMPTEVRPKKAH